MKVLKSNDRNPVRDALTQQCIARANEIGGIVLVTGFEGSKAYSVHVFGSTINITGIKTASPAT